MDAREYAPLCQLVDVRRWRNCLVFSLYFENPGGYGESASATIASFPLSLLFDPSHSLLPPFLLHERRREFFFTSQADAHDVVENLKGVVPLWGRVTGKFRVSVLRVLVCPVVCFLLVGALYFEEELSSPCLMEDASVSSTPCIPSISWKPERLWRICTKGRPEKLLQNDLLPPVSFFLPAP